MNHINKLWAGSLLSASSFLAIRANRKIYEDERFEHKCNKAIQLQRLIRQKQYPSKDAPELKRNIDRALKIAARLKGWDSVRNYVNGHCNGNEEAYICLLVTVNLLERFDGLTKRAQELLLQLEEIDFDNRLRKMLLDDSDLG